MKWLYDLAVRFWPNSDILQDGELYLRTFYVWRPKWSQRFFGIKTGGIYIHQFLKSDDHPPHDHSWPYRTFILKGGYMDLEFKHDEEVINVTRLWPGMTVKRPASHTHQVRLMTKTCWTLMFVAPVERDFYFYPRGQGPVLWWRYLGYTAEPKMIKTL